MIPIGGGRGNDTDTDSDPADSGRVGYRLGGEGTPRLAPQAADVCVGFILFYSCYLCRESGGQTGSRLK